MPCGSCTASVCTRRVRHSAASPMSTGNAVSLDDSAPAAGSACGRTALHARAAGCRPRPLGCKVVHGEVGEVSQDVTSVRCGDFHARYLAAADGLHSPIRASLGLAGPSAGCGRFGIRRHHSMTPWSDCVEVYWAADAEAYVTPVADDCVGVAILTARKGRIRRAPRCIPRVEGSAARSRSRP